MDNWLRKKGLCIGLDIGTRLIKAVEISREEKVDTISKFNFVEIDFPLNYENTLTALRSLLSGLDPSTKDVNISLSAPAAVVRFIKMPRMKPEDLKHSLRFEAEKYIPYNIDEVIIDAYISDENIEGNQMGVILAAAKKEAVNSKLATLKEAGFSVCVIDVDSFACFNAFCNSQDKLDDTRHIALLNIGYSQTNVIISRGAKPLFTRDIQIGGKDITKLISKQMDITEKDADNLIFDPKEKRQEMFELAKTVFNLLTDELRLSFGYYENQYGQSVNEVYISGGIARMDGIPEYFEENLGLEPRIWNPFDGFQAGPNIDSKSLEMVRSQFAVCAGLAIRQ